MTIPTLRIATLAGLIALMLTGCGDAQGALAAGPGAPRAQNRAAIERIWDDMYDASRAGDGKRFCGHTTAGYARRLASATGTTSCAEAVRTLSRFLNDAVPARARPRYSRFSTHGHNASIRVTLAAHDGALRNDVRWRFVDHQWRVDHDSNDDA